MSNRKRRGKIELSPHTATYIKLRKAGLSYKELSQEANMRGEYISAQAFYRFFKKRREELTIDERTKEILSLVEQNGTRAISDTQDSINTLDEIKRNLNTLQALTAALVQSNPQNASEINACTNLLRETRLTIESLESKRKDMIAQSEQSVDMAIATLLSYLQEIPGNCPKCGESLDIKEQIQKKLTE